MIFKASGLPGFHHKALTAITNSSKTKKTFSHDRDRVVKVLTAQIWFLRTDPALFKRDRGIVQ